MMFQIGRRSAVSKSKTRRLRAFRPGLSESSLLERRQLLSADVFTVTNANPSGTGSAFAAFTAATADTNPAGVVVNFTSAVGGATINLNTGTNNPWNISESVTLTGPTKGVTLDIPTGIIFRGTTTTASNMTFAGAVAPGNTPADSALYVGPGDSLALTSVSFCERRKPDFRGGRNIFYDGWLDYQYRVIR